MANEKQQATNAVAQRDVNQVTYQAGGEEITLNPTTIKNYLTKGNGEITGQEAILFMNLCKYQKLNPFINEAHLVKFGTTPAQLIVGKDAFMKRAEDHEQFEGFRAGLIVSRDGEIVNTEGSFTIKGDVLLGGWCEVYRKDRKYPIVANVGFEEYASKNEKSIWSSKPKTMIRKVAIVQALREAFPKNLGGMYVEEEVEYEVITPNQSPTPTEKKTDANSTPFVVNEDKPAPKTTIKEPAKIVDVEPTEIEEEPGF